MVEHESREYPPRTIQNVEDSDGTVWFGFPGSPGGRLTARTAYAARKPMFVNPSVQELRQWVVDNNIQVLNVAGNRTSTLNPDIFEGKFKGHCLYFRARGSHWYFGIADTEEKALWGKECLYCKEEKYGSDFHASWMPHKEALELIEQCVLNYLVE